MRSCSGRGKRHQQVLLQLVMVRLANIESLATYSSGAGSVGIDGSWRQMRTQRSNVRSSFGSARLMLALQRLEARVAVVRQLGRNRT
ncbi:putative dimethylaniline monooxygenase [N-oxide-forming] 6 [Fusarium oxysporum f. sp. albedinis]|nr:putative dimethylaniline monooxygenase [N-oxide-forming] 6 [Fusarium oxysporum f. sp. albedinis]